MQIFHQFHDGFLDGIRTNGQRSARVHLYLRTVDGETFIAIVDGVVALNLSGFRVGNIIFDVSVFDRDEVNAEHIEELYELPLEGGARSKMRSMLLDKVRAEKLVLLSIAPSYGAMCTALGHAVDLVEETSILSPGASK